MNEKYARSQILIHWAVVLLVVLAWAAIELRGFIPKGLPLRAEMKTLHFTFGSGVLVLMLLRVGLRLRHRAPAILPAPPRWQTLLAHAAHGCLYLMLIGLPLLGLTSLWAGQVSWSLCGMTMPVSAVPRPDVQEQLISIHKLIANTGYFLIGLHAAAALYHHYVVKDSTLRRMLPWR
ncbi:cytochrome b [Pantoea sp. 1.19]|uniref:cytochrome b n=1 Tax=Pantoea sp. 1.19 TaxID=1925589 RepID=UPI000948E943|nr:cytochrome b [Pantoea sp. 1.19]